MGLEIRITVQTMLFLKSLLLGAGLMLLYDVFRILRLAFPAPAPVVFLQDLLYCGICAVSTFLFMVSANDGQVRIFILLGEILGMVFCAFTFSRVLMACSRVIVGLLHGTLRLLYRIVWRPIYDGVHWTSLQIMKVSNFFSSFGKKSLLRANYSLKRRRILLYNLFISGHQKQASSIEPKQQAASQPTDKRRV